MRLDVWLKTAWLKINQKSACIACKCAYLNPDAASGAWQTNLKNNNDT